MKASSIKKQVQKEKAEAAAKAAEEAKTKEAVQKAEATKAEEPVKEPEPVKIEETVPPAKEEKGSKALFMELVRFVVIGVAATLIDYVVSLLVVQLLGLTGLNDGSTVGKYVLWGIATAVGFLVSNVFNYLLSYIWVFRGGKKQKRRFGVFTLLGAVGLILGIALQLSGTATCEAAFGIDLGDLTVGAFEIISSGEYMTIIAFTIVFVIKTAVTMVYNYVSRKLILFKNPEGKKE